MGARAVDDRPEQIDTEWRLATKGALEDPAVVESLSDPTYGFPLGLPDGNYGPAEEWGYWVDDSFRPATSVDSLSDSTASSTS